MLHIHTCKDRNLAERLHRNHDIQEDSMSPPINAETGIHKQQIQRGCWDIIDCMIHLPNEIGGFREREVSEEKTRPF
jgi:hypothetical protein